MRNSMRSPLGTAIWPKLNEPDTRFKEHGEYSVKLAVPQEEAESFISQLKEFYQDGYSAELKKQNKAKLKVANMPWSDQEDDQGNPTGMVEFKFKANAKYKYDDQMVENRVLLFDAKKQRCTARIGAGSKLKVAFEPYVWFVSSMGCGMTLRLKAVQVIDLVEFNSGANADDFFEEEEGFTAVGKAATEEVDDFNF